MRKVQSTHTAAADLQMSKRIKDKDKDVDKNRDRYRKESQDEERERDRERRRKDKDKDKDKKKKKSKELETSQIEDVEEDKDDRGRVKKDKLKDKERNKKDRHLNEAHQATQIYTVDNGTTKITDTFGDIGSSEIGTSHTDQQLKEKNKKSRKHGHSSERDRKHRNHHRHHRRHIDDDKKEKQDNKNERVKKNETILRINDEDENDGNIISKHDLKNTSGQPSSKAQSNIKLPAPPPPLQPQESSSKYIVLLASSPNPLGSNATTSQQHGTRQSKSYNMNSNISGKKNNNEYDDVEKIKDKRRDHQKISQKGKTNSSQIHEAEKYIPIENLCLSTQCGFASGEQGNIITEEEQWAKIALVIRVAKKVWSDA
ncbi:MAG: hypothetical protein EZS28_019911 [Streblomastix strix]|uniref:Cobalamin-independent methionine synthase MetE C-terminal/archaeal domain-containing protein n=1 Tax=Streblomastix strix TaxID=222440 RepID=A0A5J4VPY1_9EUKA|nr:MAG: hypothetical protein EZS28_019911 [Streblomastix strix]